MKNLIIMAGLSVVTAFPTFAQQSFPNRNTENPLLKEWKSSYRLPPFEQIKPEHYKEAFLIGIKEEENDINVIINQTAVPTFDNTIEKLDRSGKTLRKISAVFYGLASAQSSPEILALQAEMSPVLSKHGDNIQMNEELFKRVKKIYDSQDKLSLNKEQRRLLTDTYKNFVRNGALLSEESKDRLKQINEQISSLQTKFGQNLLAETASYKLIIDNEKDLSGLPSNFVQAAANRAKSNGMEGKWMFGLDNPSIMPFLQFADNRDLRKQILTAYQNRCNNNNDKDNKEIIKQLLSLRSEKAKLLGFPTYADYALDDRMAKKPQAVYGLLDQIWIPALYMAKQEAAAMQKMMGIVPLEAWDWRYYNEKLLAQNFDISEEKLRPYFQSDHVREGIFWVANQLYGISFTELKDVSKPHPDAKAFLCKDADGKTTLGILYIDLFARPGFKRGGAWCGSYRTQTYEGNVRTLPITTIVCNFTPPLGDKPALLSADEVETFFHEFGHALHNLFKDVHYYGVAGVARDFVELPSQIMEHWAFQPQVLKQYARHYQTGEIIPQDLVDKLIKSGKFGQGFATIEYLAASYLDMDYHVSDNPEIPDVLKFETEVLNNKRGLIKQIPPRYRSTYFQHTMTGGYTSGYYSYIWAEVLDADAFKAFEESGDIFNKELAAKFRQYILAPGCIDEESTMYKNFRGHEPGIDALLENRGLK